MPLLLTDLDDTALDRDGAFASWATSFLADVGSSNEHDLRWLRAQDQEGRRDKTEFFGAVRERFNLPTSVPQLVQQFRAEFPRYFALGRDVAERLTRCRERGWKIAIVTNGSADQQRKIDVSGLASFVDAVAISSVVGARKPDPAIFEAAAAATGASLDGAWMIGDHPESDIVGAAGLGLATIWISRNREWPLTDLWPTHIAQSFFEALAVLPD